MKKIIALRGKNNSGKSSTIRLLYDLLVAHGYKVVSSNLGHDGSDFRAVLKKRNALVGITSASDTYDLVHDDLEVLIGSGCSVCVCSCRSFDRNEQGTNAAIESFKSYQKQFFDKTVAPVASKQSQFNKIDSQALLNSIEAELTKC